VSGRFVAEKGRAVVTADGDKIGLTTEVVFRRKAGDLAVDGYTEQ
jgi:uncharacterized protein YrrD